MGCIYDTRYYPEDSKFESSNATLNAVFELCR